LTGKIFFKLPGKKGFCMVGLDSEQKTNERESKMTIQATNVKPIKKTELADAKLRRKEIEAAIVAIAGVCDGAHSPDGIGFNGSDTMFGKSLASQISKQNRKLTYKQAYMAVKMLKKYSKQILAAGCIVPTDSDLQAAYPSDYAGLVKASDPDTATMECGF
jgi:hypothetical protein